MDPREWIEFYEELEKIKKDHKIQIWYQPTYANKGNIHRFTQQGYRGCIGRTLDRISIFPDGRAYVCSYLFDTAQNMFQMVDGNVKINREENEFELFTKVLTKPSCSTCKAPKTCLGGCPAEELSMGISSCEADSEIIPVCRLFGNRIIDIMYWVLIFFTYLLHAEETPSDFIKNLFHSPLLQEDVQFTPLSGLTNKNYLFIDEGKKYVIRFPGKGTENFIDRNIEQVNSKQAYFHKFNPTYTILFDPATGRQLTPFIEECKSYEFEEFYGNDLLKQTANLLHKIHTSSLVFKNHIDLFTRMDCLEFYLQEQTISIPSEYFSLKTALQKHAHLDCFEAFPSHGDPVPSNFTLLNGKLMLFDWEYSGLADPAYDLAFLCTVMNYSKEQKKNLLHYYGVGCISLINEKVIYFKPIIESWLGLWGLLQTISCNESQKDFFRTFSSARFKRAERVLGSKEYKRAIELLIFFHKKDGKLFRAFPLDPKISLITSFPKLSEQVGLTQIEFGLWICPYCGILNPIAKRCCICPNCPLK